MHMKHTIPLTAIMLLSTLSDINSSAIVQADKIKHFNQSDIKSERRISDHDFVNSTVNSDINNRNRKMDKQDRQDTHQSANNNRNKNAKQIREQDNNVSDLNSDEKNNDNNNTNYTPSSELISVTQKYQKILKSRAESNKQLSDIKVKQKLLNNKIKQNKSDLSQLNKEYQKQVEILQKKDDNGFLDWLYSILPWLNNIFNYKTKQQKKEILQKNKVVAKKLSSVKSKLKYNQTQLANTKSDIRQTKVDLKQNNSQRNQVLDSIDSSVFKNSNKINKKLLQKNYLSAIKSVKANQNSNQANLSSSDINSDINTPMSYLMQQSILIPTKVNPAELSKGLPTDLKQYATDFISVADKYNLNVYILATLAELNIVQNGKSNNNVGKNNLLNLNQKDYDDIKQGLDRNTKTLSLKAEKEILKGDSGDSGINKMLADYFKKTGITASEFNSVLDLSWLMSQK